MNPRALRILAGLVLGLLAGGLLAGRPAAGPVGAVAAPVGRLWLDALTMTVVPLVFALLVTGIIGAAQEARGSRVAFTALLWFAGLLVGAGLVAAAWATTLLHVWPVPAAADALRPPGGPPPAVGSAGDWIANIVPTNPLKAASDTAMVPLVVFALFFGFAATRIADELRDALRRLFRATAETMLVIVGWVLLAAPAGVFALALGLGLRTGAGAVGVLAHYVAVVASGCLAVTLIAYLVVTLAGRLSPARFARAALPAQVVAVSTQSSLATLPAMVEAAPALGVGEAPAGVVLPLAVSVFRTGSVAANVGVALYVAHVAGHPPGPLALLVAALVAAAVSLAAVGLPAQVSFFATIGPVCLAIGVPVELLPVLLAVESLPDLFRTLTNVTWDLAVLRLAGRSAGAGEDRGDQCDPVHV